MKLKREFTNGFFIFLGIGIYFLAMELLGWSNIYWLRTLNIFIVFFFVNKTLKDNIKEGKTNYWQNIFSGGLTSLIGVFLSVAALRVYLVIMGGAEYLKKLSQVFIFGGGEPSINDYCIGLLVEGAASSMIAVFCLMQYWKNYTVID